MRLRALCILVGIILTSACDDGNEIAAGSSGDEESSGEDGASPADGSSDEGSSTDDSSGSDDGSQDASGDVNPAPDQLPPIGEAALVPWLAAETYAGWVAESQPHVSAGPHASAVRTYFNDVLADSTAAGATEHPIGAASVKELFDADGDRSGWAVMVKVELGRGGDGWYWYEGVGAAVYADGTGDALCTGCHSVGVDSVRTGWPLQ